jgi:flagellar FliJ protein
MNDLQPLMALLAQTESERDTALAQHQRALTAHEAAQSQASQLVDYRRDYEQRWTARFATVGQAELLRCYQGFADRLTHAVDHQGRVSEHTAVQVEQARESLAQMELRVASVRKLIERRVQELQRHVERREQKQLDEFATRAAWNRRAGSGPATRF